MVGIPIEQNQLSELTNLDVVVDYIFTDSIRNFGPNETDLFRLFNVQMSSQAVERAFSLSGFGEVPEYEGNVEWVAPDKRWTISYTHQEYAQGLSLRRALTDDADSNVIADMVRQFALAFERTRYKHAASVFNNAFSSGSTGADGVSLCADNHPLSSESTGVQDNKTDLTLDADAVIAAQEAMMAFTDAKEEPLTVIPDTLVVPVALRNEALVIAGSTHKPGGQLNDINTQAGYNVIVSPYLTNPLAWFLVDSRMAQMHLRWYNRVNPEVNPVGTSSLKTEYEGYMRYSYGWNDWQWIYGSDGSE